MYSSTNSYALPGPSTFMFQPSPPSTPTRPNLKLRHRHTTNTIVTTPPGLSSPSLSHPNPRFSRLLGSVLGSPFLTTSDPPELPPDLDLIDGALSAVPRTYTITRPSSPAPTADFSIISPDDVFGTYSFPAYSTSGTFSFFGTPSRRALYSSPSLGATMLNLGGSPDRGPGTPPNSLKSLLPRLWDALSSPGRNALSTSSPRNPLSISTSKSYAFCNSPGRKGKGKATSDYDYDDSSYINYSDLPPLDGEEGELIDDEACFIDVRAVTGIDILSLLPPEISLHILSTFLDLPSILACLAVSRTWRRLASDNAVWRALFVKMRVKGWGVDLSRASVGVRSQLINAGKSLSLSTASTKSARAMEDWGRRRRLSDCSGYSHTYPRMKKLPPLPDNVSRASSVYSAPLPLIRAPLTLDWRMLYQERLELDKRWAGSARADAEVTWEPQVMRITGHSDSVYCLEFDSTRIITGSRDRTIKVWSLKSGKLLGTFKGHMGSVLCLKFDKDWETSGLFDDDEDLEDEDEDVYDGDHEGVGGGEVNVGIKRKRGVTRGKGKGRRGFMVSGSSDCTVCVWDLYTDVDRNAERGKEGEVADVEVKADVRAVLKGHSGGVLDLRIDKRWIVSCSKDAVIQVWERSTLTLHQTLKGHEGPVNAVGLQSGKVVSASGDGKMILWDIESGERLRTFEGHDRGLACIEFKDDYIVSGSNDWKIKVWSASSGECLQTLVGHEALVRALSFDPRSGRLVSASYDKTVKLWDLKSGKMMREFRSSHTSHIFDVKFDVARIVSTSHDQKIVVLDFSHGLDASLFV